MNRVLLFTAAAVVAPVIHADEIDGPRVLAQGFQGLRHYLKTSPTAPAAGWQIIFGLGPWIALYELNLTDGNPMTAVEFVDHYRQEIERGLTLEKLYRLAFPNDAFDIANADQMLTLALRPVAGGFLDLADDLKTRAAASRIVGADERCQTLISR